MKKITCIAKYCLPLVLVLLFANNILAQKGQQPDMKEVQAQMRAAQHTIDSVKQIAASMIPGNAQAQMQAAQHTTQHVMDSINAKDPTLLPSGGKVPIANLIDPIANMPDMEKLSKDMNANMANVQHYQSQAKEKRDQSLPKKTGSSFTAVANPGKAMILSYANSILPGAIEGMRKIDMSIQQSLDEAMKDTTITPQALGMLMLSNGAPKYLVQYLICKGVIKDPDNPWAINDLGIIFRNEKKNKEAAQCFRYAYSFNDTFLIIKCNLAWAVAYYGDFITAKRLFYEITDKLPNYNEAWEGLGMIAYQEGDIETLFRCLAKQVKAVGGGGDGPSDNFTSFCGGVIDEQKMNNIGKPKTDDPAMDNTMDNNNGEESANYDPPPNGDSEYPTYPSSMGGMFAQSWEGLQPLVYSFLSNTQLVKKKIIESQQKVADKLAAMKPMVDKPYQDDQGLTVTPANFDRWYKMFYFVHTDFEERASDIYKQFDADWKIVEKSITATNRSFMENYTKEYIACAKYAKSRDCEVCLHTLYCKWVPMAKGNLSTNLGAISKLWTKYYKKITNTCDWYISASTPDIKRMVKQDRNEYENAIREDDIRHAILAMYDKWLVAQAVVSNGAILQIAQMNVECFTEVREIPANGPDPTSVKMKKLRTAADWCDPTSATKGSLAGFYYESNCAHTKFGFKVSMEAGTKVGASDKDGKSQIGVSAGATASAELGIAVEHVRDQKFADGDYYNVSTTMAVGVTASAGVSMGATGELGGASASAGVKANANIAVESGWRFNSSGNITGRYKDIDISAGISSSSKETVTANGADPQNMFSTQHGGSGELKMEIFAARGADGNYSDYNITSSSATKH